MRHSMIRPAIWTIGCAIASAGVTFAYEPPPPASAEDLAPPPGVAIAWDDAADPDDNAAADRPPPGRPGGPPPPRPPGPGGPTGERPHRGPAGERPSGFGAPPPRPADVDDGPLGPRGAFGREPLMRFNPLIRMIAERNEDLARRVDRVRNAAPDRFEDWLADTLMPHLEAALAKIEPQLPRDDGARPPPGRRPPLGRPGVGGPEGPRPGGPPPDLDRPPRPGGPFGPGGPPGERPPRPSPEQAEELRAMRTRIRETQERHQQIDEQIRRVVETLARGDRPGTDADRQKLAQDVHHLLQQQFDVRTELRRLELERMETEIRMLQQQLERVRTDMDRRGQQREKLIERHLQRILDGPADDR